METFLIPLHMGPVVVVPPFFGVIAVMVTIAVIRLLRTGRVGPIRLDRSGTAAPGPRWGHTSPEDDALATLRQRLASGDITVEEYLERSSVLRPSTTSES